jgi:formylmethanofuran dehydrogenase subunit E
MRCVRVLLVVLLAFLWRPPALWAQHVHAPAQPKPQAPASDLPDDWVALGTRVHGGFGSYVALGIRIGLDALKDLGVTRGDVDVTLIDGPDNRCPCVADGLLLATGATPGRATLHVDGTKAPPGVITMVVVRHAKTHRSFRYTVTHDMRDHLDEWNQLEPKKTLDAVMQTPAAELYRREVAP